MDDFFKLDENVRVLPGTGADVAVRKKLRRISGDDIDARALRLFSPQRSLLICSLDRVHTEVRSVHCSSLLLTFFS